MKRFALFTGLRGRLFLLTLGFLIFAGLLIYPAAIANYRNQWLHERGQAAEIAAVAIAAAPQGEVSAQLSEQLSKLSDVVAVAVQSPDMREMVVAPTSRFKGELVPIQLQDAQGFAGAFEAIGHMMAPPGRYLQLQFTQKTDAASTMEVIAPEAALKRDLLLFTGAFLLVGLAIAAVSGVLMYVAIYRLVVRPVRVLTDSVVKFAEAPESPDAEALEKVDVRSDELRKAMLALRDMQRQVSASFRQRKRLADLGEAVAKINHDLRNSLAAAQIVSEGLAQSEDPRVKRAAPRLERAIERAIGLAEATLRYGRAEPAAPNLQNVALEPIMAEAAAEALAGQKDIDFAVEGELGLHANVDPDHLHRIVGNLLRNAVRALADQKDRTACARIRIKLARENGHAEIHVVDNGPGIPWHVRERLFQPFSGSSSRDGSGLGLAIARELARGMNGELDLTQTGPTGSDFVVRAPSA